jgi:hypothetical protein
MHCRGEAPAAERNSGSDRDGSTSRTRQLVRVRLIPRNDESIWDHLAGTISASFEAGEHGQIAVKVIYDRGNELMVVKSLKGAD